MTDFEDRDRLEGGIPKAHNGIARKIAVYKILELLFLAMLLSAFISLLFQNNQNAEEHREQVESSIKRSELAEKEAQEQLREAATGDRARSDIILCIISVSPTVRTPEYVKSCYDSVEKKFNVKVQRYGDGV